MMLAPQLDGTVRLEQVELTTIENLSQFRGLAAELVGGTAFGLIDRTNSGRGPQLIIPGFDGDRRQNFQMLAMNSPGQPPRGQFVEREGVYWPTEFHTWSMLSVYYGLEKSFKYFSRISETGSAEELARTKALYWLTQDEKPLGAEVTAPKTNNASYDPLIDMLEFYPYTKEEGVPWTMNLGTVAHEMAHRVFHIKAMGRRLVDPYNRVGWIIGAIDEGLADFHGYSVSCSTTTGCTPNFPELTEKPSSVETTRDLSSPSHCMTPDFLEIIATSSLLDTYQKYRYGSMWAASLYAASKDDAPRREALGKAVMRAYTSTDPARPSLSSVFFRMGGFSPEAIANAIVSNIENDETLQRDLCGEFATRLSLSCNTFPCAAMPACPSTAQRRSCPQ